MPFFGLMLVSTHRDALIKARSYAFADGQADGRATAPKPVNQQPMIDSLRGQLDAYKEHAAEKDSAISGYKEVIDDLKADAEKWRNRTKRERERQQKARDAAAAKKAVPKAPSAKRASKSKAGAKK
ncbi:hypothetical protein [Parasphingorhabdus sp.]|uniref:hypothetical protein n=1 Tax=Parasphingorhabdus sp. TaxID=2709688 RepID=UPI003A910976